MADRPDPKSVAFVWDQAEARIEAQLRQADALDTKAGILVGLHALAVGILVSTVPSVGRAEAVLATVAIVGLVISGLLSLLAFRSQDYDRSPRPEALWQFSTWDEERLRYRFLSTRFGAIEANRVKLKRKAVLLTVSLSVVMVLGLGLAVVAIGSLWT